MTNHDPHNTLRFMDPESFGDVDALMDAWGAALDRLRMDVHNLAHPAFRAGANAPGPMKAFSADITKKTKLMVDRIQEIEPDPLNAFLVSSILFEASIKMIQRGIKIEPERGEFSAFLDRFLSDLEI